MIHNDDITNRLKELLDKHPEFAKLSANDATVHSWLKTAMTYENREYIGSAEEMLVGIIVMLGREKEALQDNFISHMQTCSQGVVANLIGEMRDKNGEKIR